MANGIQQVAMASRSWKCNWQEDSPSASVYQGWAHKENRSSSASYCNVCPSKTSYIQSNGKNTQLGILADWQPLQPALLLQGVCGKHRTKMIPREWNAYKAMGFTYTWSIRLRTTTLWHSAFQCFASPSVWSWPSSHKAVILQLPLLKDFRSPIH